jgi:hypothetical protein
MIWYICPCCSTRLYACDSAVGRMEPCPVSGAQVRIPPGTPYREADWLAETSAEWVVACAGEKARPRKRRLFVCACCRHVERLWLGPGEGRKYAHALEVSERYADGEASLGQLSLAEISLDVNNLLMETLTPTTAARSAVAHAVRYRPQPGEVFGWLDYALRQAGQAEEGKGLCELARDVFGNPFRPVTADPAWLCANDHAVRKVARVIYADRAFGDLPILADALEEAGCADEQLLTHCRGGGLHARGCWAVDLALGKG